MFSEEHCDYILLRMAEGFPLVSQFLALGFVELPSPPPPPQHKISAVCHPGGCQKQHDPELGPAE